MLGVTEEELAAIEKAPFKEGEERLKRLKARVRKNFKRVVHEFHPDTNGGDREKSHQFDLLVRATKELYARQARADIPGIGVDPQAVPRAPRWQVNTAAVPGGATKPVMQAHVRRPYGGQDTREQAVRLGKMRP
jgi:hypothetical protein